MSIQQYCVVAATSFVFCVFSASVVAQQTPEPSETGGKIQLDVAVTTTKGEPVGNLSEREFTVLDNKTRGPIASFTTVEGKDAPVRVVIVVDSVNTPYEYLAYQRNQIARYLRSNSGKLPYLTTFAVLSDTKLGVYKGASKDGDVLAKALEHTEIGLRTIDRAQGFYGAGDRMSLSLDALRSLAVAEGKKPGRKLVLWVSPGWPLLSGPEVDLDGSQAEAVYRSAIAFSTELRRADITLYNINSWGPTENVGRDFFYRSFLGGLKGPVNAAWGNLGLQVLAEQSGGLVLNSNDVIAMMKQCVADANQYYRIVLDMPAGEPPNAYHKIDVKVAQDGLVARTRQGYYAQP